VRCGCCRPASPGEELAAERCVAAALFNAARTRGGRGPDGGLNAVSSDPGCSPSCATWWRTTTPTSRS
jgi:hypothetical protein